MEKETNQEEQKKEERNNRPFSFDVKEIENGFVCQISEVINDNGARDTKELYAKDREELHQVITNGLNRIINSRDEKE